MAAKRPSPDQQAELIAAARAAISWARARRATWTDVPLPVPAPLAQATTPTPAATASTTPARPVPTGPGVAERAADVARGLAGPALRWLPRVALFAALAAGGYYAVRYSMDYFATSRNRSAAESRNGVKPPAAAASSAPSSSKTTGDLEVNSTPPGAQVTVDGKARGATPVTVTDLKPGRHTVELIGESGTIQRTVTIAAGQTAALDESIFSGFLVLYSPFDVVVTEGSRTLRFDDRNQVMLPSGHHELRVVNRPLGYDAVERVDLKPGETARITVKPPPTPVTVTASEQAEVWLDGARIGDAPVNAMPVELGTHDIVVKRAAGGEKRFTVTITVKPLTLNADFSR